MSQVASTGIEKGDGMKQATFIASLFGVTL